ncbi:E3 ubiquitin-protein ligase Mdm2-like [Xenia sp. Carnegie-2017]|uniref:E3 ubiquitin-protein ligase Mdm2-like n=1 Tax=Xenia sp. Carnegie-2017 TaxID=2897299 RepID=UPI001F0344DE|nr:E3 ubiquitin-protein ligase Mdm2-like [Xenia sp. Carnegie-2017]
MFETERTSCSQEVDEGEDGGDELGNSDSSDSEIDEEDKWQCEACSERNHPMTRRCRRCWSKRKDWFASTLERTYSDPGQTRRENVRIDQANVLHSVCTTSSTSQLNTVVPPSTNHTPPVSTTVANETASDSTDGHDRMRCFLCYKEPPNGCIVHGMTGHQVCCVACARKLKESNKPCPVCRKKIDKVIKNYM